MKYIKSQMKEQKTLSNISINSELSCTSRLNNFFVTIESMTPGECKNQGKSLTIYYSYPETIFGSVCIASTDKGICYLAFGEQPNTFNELVQMLPHANFIQQEQAIHQKAIIFLQNTKNTINSLPLHIKGTEFQLKVWNTLLKIPFGQLTTYGELSKHLNNPQANRAVGTAVGSNPISYIIPCHRVIRSDGELGGYRWGVDLKMAMIEWEAANAK